MCIPAAQEVGTKITSQNEPLIFAKDMDQCFFITDPIKPSCVVMRRGKRNIIGIHGVANEDDFDQNGYPKEEENDKQDEKHTGSQKSRTMLPTSTDHAYKRSSHNAGLKYTSKTKKTKKTVEKIVKRR
jgi:hypothetical protein